jgi:hypothetical protein
MAENETEMVALLRELQQGQRQQLQRQDEQLALQREQLAPVRQQFDHAERLQARAEALQQRGGTALKLVTFLLIPLALLLAALILVR